MKILLLAVLVGCASVSVEKPTPEQIDLAKAKEFQKAGRYELAIEHYSNVKNKYPLSSEAIEAELELAQTFFLQVSYVEARAGFESFIDLHPRHNKVDFAAYQSALSHYQQIPLTIDRDLTPAAEAILAFDNFVKRYSTSSYVPEAKIKKLDCMKKLSEKELYIADFYFKQKNYKSAQGRYQSVLKKYSGFNLNEKALFRLGLCYYHQNDKHLAKETLNQFIKQFPNSSFLNEAKVVLNNL